MPLFKKEKSGLEADPELQVVDDDELMRQFDLKVQEYRLAPNIVQKQVSTAENGTQAKTADEAIGPDKSTANLPASATTAEASTRRRLGSNITDHMTQNGGGSAPSNYELIPPPVDMADWAGTKNRIENVIPDRDFGWLRPITDEEVREALRNEVRRHKYWKKEVVQKMEIKNIECFSALHYTLETFAESRATCKGSEPFNKSTVVDTSTFPENADFSVEIWNLPCEPRGEFCDETRLFEIPGTSDLEQCTSCNSEGTSLCFHCRGSGQQQCRYCRGTGMKAGIPHPAVYTHPMVAHGVAATIGSIGINEESGYRRKCSAPATMSRARREQRQYQSIPSRLRYDSGNGGGFGGRTVSQRGGAPLFGHSAGMAYAKGTPAHYVSVSGIPPPGIGQHDLCFLCYGRGVQECTHCQGHGKKTCAKCSGSGSIRTYLKLRVKYCVERTDYFHSVGDVPENLLKQVTGEVVMAESLPMVVPLKLYPVEEVNDASKRLVQIHLQKCVGQMRMLQQRHLLEAIPVAEVKYELGSKSGTFWIYGQERLCYIPKYPAKCAIL